MPGRDDARAYRRRLAEEDRLTIRPGGSRAGAFAGFGEGSFVEGPQLRLVGEHAIRVGAGVSILKYACLEAYAAPGVALIEIGDGCYLNHFVRIVGVNGIRIGAGTTTGTHVTLTDTIHDYKAQPGAFWEAPLVTGRPLEIGARVLVGVGSVVIGGITVGDDAIIGPNCVIARDVPAGAMVQGNPARVVKTRRGDGEWETLVEPVLL